MDIAINPSSPMSVFVLLIDIKQKKEKRRIQARINQSAFIVTVVRPSFVLFCFRYFSEYHSMISLHIHSTHGLVFSLGKDEIIEIQWTDRCQKWQLFNSNRFSLFLLKIFHRLDSSDGVRREQTFTSLIIKCLERMQCRNLDEKIYIIIRRKFIFLSTSWKCK